VALIIDLITFTEPNKAEIADAASESKFLVISVCIERLCFHTFLLGINTARVI
jgi:hypothetical protein